MLFVSSLDSILDVDPQQGPPPGPTPQLVPHRAPLPYLPTIGSAGRYQETPSQVNKLLKEFLGLINSGNGSPHPRHRMQHVIETTGRPVFPRSHHLDPDKLQTSKEEFRKLELAGIIRRSDSPWVSPLHMVKKPDGTWRPCVDYRRLNNITTLDRYPLPNMQDLGNKLSSCHVFSRLDLVKGYHQVPVADAHVPKTTIITWLDLYKYLYMPFGLKKTAQSFQ